jgi:Subtilase family
LDERPNIRPDGNATAETLISNEGIAMRKTLSNYNVIVVTSAGNDYGGGGPKCLASAVWNSPFTWAALSTAPAALPPSPNVIVVESFSIKANQRSFSSDCDGAISAPGESVLSATNVNNKYDFGSGTSQAAAEITAVVGLMVAYNPAMSVAEVRQFLGVGSAQPPPVPNAFISLASCRPPDEVAHDLANLVDPPGDADKVDMADFLRFKNDLLEFESWHPKSDLNGNGKPDANDLKFPRSDLNGDGAISRTGLAFVPGLGMVTDL